MNKREQLTLMGILLELANNQLNMSPDDMMDRLYDADSLKRLGITKTQLGEMFEQAKRALKKLREDAAIAEFRKSSGVDEEGVDALE